MSGAWSQLEQLLTCAICLDRFRNPKLLPCQHTFCGEPCMEGLVDYARRQIKCPECRAEHRIPYNGVQSFPNNVTLARFLDLHRSITGDEPEPLPSQMDRCSVCGEKSYCNRCAHCEKKVCEECGKGHLDILRREINRINTQVRRSLEKLSEHAEQANKGSEKLLQITGQIRDEITESVRRLIKDLKDKETKLLEELDEYTESETKNSSKLKTDFETELDTITSNCELVEKHITDADEWTDQELMEYKDIFLKTLDFLRNLDPDSMDYSRKIKFIQKVDLDALRRSAIEFGEIKIQSSSSNFSSPLSPSESTNNLSLPQSSLMRSQSDHRLAQFGATGSRSQRSDPLQRSYLDVTGQNRYGSDSERGSSPPGRRSGEVRFGSVHERSSRLGGSGSGGRNDSNDFSYTRGWPRPGDSDYEPSNSANFRSRFMRERIRERAGNAGAEDHSFEDHDSDTYPAHRVRFQEESPSRPKLFDTEEMINMRAPLSGLIKLIDSPHFMERLQQNEIKAKQREAEAKENENLMDSLTASTPTRVSSPQPVTATPQRPSRQISEDEIEKQKKQNQAAFSQANSNNQTIPASSVTTPTQPTVTSASNANTNQPQSPIPRSTNKSAPINRRIQSIQKEERGQSPSLPTTPTLSDDNNSESGGPTVNDDDIVTVPNSSNNNTSYSRRRIFASQGKTGSGSTNASVSQSLDYGDSRPSSKSSSAAINNRQVYPSTSSFLTPSSSSSATKRLTLVPGEDLMTGTVQPHSISPSKLLLSSTSPSTSSNDTSSFSSPSSSKSIGKNPSSSSSYNSKPRRFNKKSSNNSSSNGSHHQNSFGSGGGGNGSDLFDDYDDYSPTSTSTTSLHHHPQSRHGIQIDSNNNPIKVPISASTISMFNSANSSSPITITPRYQNSANTGNTMHHASSLSSLVFPSASVFGERNSSSLYSSTNTPTPTNNWRDFQTSSTGSTDGTTSSSTDHCHHSSSATKTKTKTENSSLLNLAVTENQSQSLARQCNPLLSHYSHSSSDHNTDRDSIDNNINHSETIGSKSRKIRVKQANLARHFAAKKVLDLEKTNFSTRSINTPSSSKELTSPLSPTILETNPDSIDSFRSDRNRFTGQIKPDYKPFRQSKQSLSTGSGTSFQNSETSNAPTTKKSFSLKMPTIVENERNTSNDENRLAVNRPLFRHHSVKTRPTSALTDHSTQSSTSTATATSSLLNRSHSSFERSFRDSLMTMGLPIESSNWIK